MRWLLDTCVIFEGMKRRPSRRVLRWLEARDEGSLHLSVLTLGELHKGIEKLQDEERRRRLEIWVQVDLVERFRGRILAVDASVARTWGTVQATAEREGLTLPAVDGLIAATAIAHDLIVVTRNVTHMRPSGARIVDPWVEV